MLRTLILTFSLAMASACATPGAAGDSQSAPRWETAVVNMADIDLCIAGCSKESPFAQAVKIVQSRAGEAIDVQNVRTVGESYVIRYRRRS